MYVLQQYSSTAAVLQHRNHAVIHTRAAQCGCSGSGGDRWSPRRVPQGTQDQAYQTYVALGPPLSFFWFVPCRRFSGSRVFYLAFGVRTANLQLTIFRF